MKDKHRLFSLFLLLPLCLSSCSEKRDISSLTKIEEIANNEEYILGVDLSSIIEVENAGGVFYDYSGKQSDIFHVLSESGINYIRIRLWVDPFDEEGNSFEGGGNDLETDLEIAARATEAGMKVLLDFHYSDFWADPGKQIIPRDWEGLTGEELYKRASEYTTDVLEAFSEAGATPSMVQLGNEINNEWICGVKGEEFYAFIGACSKAVRSYDPSIEIALHLAMDQSISTLISSYNGFISHDIDFDIIGLSYYPYWHGSLSTLDTNLSKLEETFDKKISIMEYAYGYTLDSKGMSSNTSNIFNKSCERNGGYEATPTGQALCIYDINKTISAHPNVIGSFYWEPAWLGLEGTSWASESALTYQYQNKLDTSGLGTCSWVNQALFDSSGHPLDSLHTYSIMKGIS